MRAAAAAPASLTLVALLCALSAVACSPADENEPPTEILCAAESLYMARDAGRSRAEEDRLRARSDLFTGKLPISERHRLWTKVDQLADRRGTQPLVAASACDALLTPEDRRQLAASAAAEAITHQEPLRNSQ